MEAEFGRNLLIDNWDSLNLINYSTIKLPCHQRKLSLLVKEIVLFLHDWLKDSSKGKLRHYYLELATLLLLFHGGTLPESMTNTTIKAPWALYYASWMSKSLYTLNIALFRQQLQQIYEVEQLEEIVSLATFLSVFYP